jgi:hypothetical protein
MRPSSRCPKLTGLGWRAKTISSSMILAFSEIFWDITSPKTSEGLKSICVVIALHQLQLGSDNELD